MRVDGQNPSLGPYFAEQGRIHGGAFWLSLPFALGVPLLVGLVLWIIQQESDGKGLGVAGVVGLLAAAFAVIAIGEFCGRRGARVHVQARERELERLHTALRRSEERFDAILHQSAVGIAVAGMDGRILVVNDRLCSMLGYSCEELRYRSYRDITDPEDLPADDEYARMLVGGQINSYSMEKRFVRRDGTSLWAHLTCSAVRGETDYVLAIVEDISDRRRAQDAMKENEAKFRTLAENVRALIGIVQGTRIIYANRHFAQVSGYSTDELMSMEFAALVHPRSREMVADYARRRQLGESVPSNYEFEMITRHGEARWIDFSASTVEVNGKPAVIGAGFDITSRKQAEETLRASEAHLVEAKEMAESANRAKDHFLAVLSHELRTPLTPVLATASALRHGQIGSEETRENLAMICRNVELEAQLIDDLLDLTRLSRGKVELRPQTVQAAVVLRHTVEICANEIAGKGLQLHVDAGEGNWWLRADPPRLQQVFWNLLNNATKFTPSGGRIDVRMYSGTSESGCVSADDGCVVVEVSDTGVGIAPDVLPRIFDAFEQGSRMVTRTFGGLGLGLAISKAVVEMHGGSISAYSEGTGKGTMFRVALPTITPPAAQEARSPDAPVERDHRPARILLVEDHADTARVMGRLLEAAGHHVRVAYSVATGRAAVAQEEFDLIISDLGLPDGSGLELMQSLHREQPQMRGIALSGYGMEEDRARSRAAGFAEHLTKPVSFDQLEAAIARVLAHRPDGPSAT